MFKSHKLVSILLLSSLSFAADETDSRLPDPTQIEKKRIEGKYDATAPNLEKGKVLNNQGSQNQPVILYKYNFELKTLQRQGGIVKGEKIQRKEREETKEASPQDKNSNVEEKKEIVYKGYCIIDRGYEVSLEEVFVQSECILNRNKIMKAYISLIPDIERYMLTGKVLSLNDKKVKESVVKTADRTSINIADEVDRRIISNILLASSRDTAKEVSSSIEGVMKDAGKRTYQGTFGNTITQTDVKKGVKDIVETSHYLAIANLLKSTSNEILSDKKRLPPLFIVKPKKEVYVEVVMDD